MMRNRRINIGVCEMTKQDYKMLADSCKSTMPVRCWAVGAGLSVEYRVWLRIVNGLADACARQNAQFNRNRFLDACGVPITDVSIAGARLVVPE